MRIVVIGGAGRVASLVVPRLAGEHQVTVADRQPADWWDGDFTQLDLLDHQQLPSLFEGADALVFMAMGPMEDWGTTQWARQHFDVNVTGLHLATQAAGRAGVQRIVHTSSGSVFTDWERRHPDESPDATDPYGLSKACGEVVARAAAEEFGIPVVALRLFLPKPDDVYRALTDSDGHIATAGSDVANAYLAALDAHLPAGFHVTHISGNRAGKISIAHANKLLGWRPLVN